MTNKNEEVSPSGAEGRAPTETPERLLRAYLESRKALLNAVQPLDEKAANTKWHRLNELEQLETALSPIHTQHESSDPVDPPKDQA